MQRGVRQKRSNHKKCFDEVYEEELMDGMLRLNWKTFTSLNRMAYMETSNPLLKREGAFSGAWDRTAPMTLQGVINKTGILLLLCLGAAAFAWTQPDLRGPLILLGLVGGLIACLVGIFKPATTPITAPIYAVLEGLFLGAISQVIELRYHGIVANAMLLTFGVLALMLVLYTTRTIRVTDKLIKGVFIATASVCLVYVVDLVLNMFGTRVAYIHEAGPIGIGISLVIVGIAAFNLLVDFAVIEDGVRKGSPRFMEWYCGMALLVTLVWLYLEILRLLSKLRGRN
jgi:uncharacterized YccA/Bax inhibitor family protein